MEVQLYDEIAWEAFQEGFKAGQVVKNRTIRERFEAWWITPMNGRPWLTEPSFLERSYQRRLEGFSDHELLGELHEACESHSPGAAQAVNAIEAECQRRADKAPAA